MKITWGIIVLLAAAAPGVCAQPARSTGTVSGVAPSARAAAKRPGPAAAEDKKAVQIPADEEGGVMIDDRMEDDYPVRAARRTDAAESDDSAAPEGIPASYGQLKGTINEGGKSVLLFEDEDGMLSFVQVYVGKNAVSWKLISRVGRSAE
jgi:hypothetical protein